MKIVLNEELDARFPGLLDSVLIPATRALPGSGLVDEADRILTWAAGSGTLRHLLRTAGSLSPRCTKPSRRAAMSVAQKLHCTRMVRAE
jgi:hypothetical protein